MELERPEDLPSLAARLPSFAVRESACPRVSGKPTSPLKTRLRDFCRPASGLFCSGRPRSRSIATGSKGCGYKTASDLRRWPSRDPIEEKGGVNLYGFVRNQPLDRRDPRGLSDENRPPIVVFPPGSGQLPIYGPPKSEPRLDPSSSTSFLYCPLPSMWDCVGKAAHGGANAEPLALKRDPYGRYTHCVTSCYIARECGTQVARIAAWVMDGRVREDPLEQDDFRADLMAMPLRNRNQVVGWDRLTMYIKSPVS